ncbi:MAG: type II toxin-antitoxin system RelE/ParE family toxin [Betaproteobacteria bacterium]|nr:type II toxin-antitoxin system RelE/ParE family toxin [Betaproteobacteria bacterium]MBI2291286.1 type II toxin-antitoxin system RelE/ParE family toxin [Betaproteobacteria bacterium]MBI3057347.1 type II toxin-antitoxin system RelE/ParE family toxin [Betaproteobacteria bacterium]
MKRYRARYTPEAAARIRALHPQIKRDVREGIRTLMLDPLAGKPLQWELAGYRSLRVRQHRIVYRLSAETASIDIVFVGIRRTVYEELQAALRARHRDA